MSRKAKASERFNQHSQGKDHQWERFRKEAVRLAIRDGYFNNGHESRSYSLEQDGTWRLNANQMQWFKVTTRYEDHE